MSPIEERLEALLAAAGVRIITTTALGGWLNAVYHEPTRTIYIRKGLDAVTRTCMIAHELGHAYYGHRCSSPRAEREADDWAALNLITEGEVRAAAREHAGAPAAIAAELGVTPHLLAVWARLHQVGRTTRRDRLLAQ